MKNRYHDILKVRSKDEIAAVVERLGNEKLTRTGHGFKEFGATPIRVAAEKSTTAFTDRWRLKPALGLISVVLAANRDYNKVVEPNLERIEQMIPGLHGFNQLSALIQTKTIEEFYELWGHKDKKKFETLKNILLKIEQLRSIYPTYRDDFDLLNKWGYCG